VFFFVEYLREDGWERPKHVEWLPRVSMFLYLIIVQWLEHVWRLDTGIFLPGQSAVGSYSFGWTGTKKKKKKLKRRSILEAKGKVRVLFCTMFPYFRKSFGFWKVPRLHPFVLLVRETCRWRGVHGKTRFSQSLQSKLPLREMYAAYQGLKMRMWEIRYEEILKFCKALERTTCPIEQIVCLRVEGEITLSEFVVIR